MIYHNNLQNEYVKVKNITESQSGIEISNINNISKITYNIYYQYKNKVISR